jgi:hypothetical protein
MQQCPSQLPKSKDSCLNTNVYTRIVVLAISYFGMWEYCLHCNVFMVKKGFHHFPAYASLFKFLRRISWQIHPIQTLLLDIFTQAITEESSR